MSPEMSLIYCQSPGVTKATQKRRRNSRPQDNKPITHAQGSKKRPSWTTQSGQGFPRFSKTKYKRRNGSPARALNGERSGFWTSAQHTSFGLPFGLWLPGFFTKIGAAWVLACRACYAMDSSFPTALFVLIGLVECVQVSNKHSGGYE